MVGGDARDARGVRAGGLHALGDLPEKLVARLAAERVVDGPEALDIDDGNRELAPRAPGRNQLLLQPLEKKRPIGEAGELVEVSEVVEFFGVRDVLEGERDVAGELQKQLHLFVVKES